MNSSHHRDRGLFKMGVGFLVIVCVVGWVFAERSRNRRALDEARRESATLRAELETRDRTITDLQAAVQPSRAVEAAGARPKVMRETSTLSDPETGLSGQIAQLMAQQSNTAGLVQRLLAKTLDPESPEQAERARQAALQTLQASAHQNQQQLETARQKAAALLVELNIPIEIATMDAGEALDKASLREYWPFFEAKRERDTLQGVAERLRMRIIQEAVDRGAGLGHLEALAQEGRQQLESARQKSKELLTTLNVPADVSTMDANKALDAATLRPYWPFFEAKRERELLQTVGERLQRRLIQEQIDAAAAAAVKAGNE